MGHYKQLHYECPQLFPHCIQYVLADHRPFTSNKHNVIYVFAISVPNGSILSKSSTLIFFFWFWVGTKLERAQWPCLLGELVKAENFQPQQSVRPGGPTAAGRLHHPDAKCCSHFDHGKLQTCL